MLIISCCKHKLHEYEFVSPLLKIFPDSKVVHYKNLTDEYDNEDKVIIAGTSLADHEYLNHLRNFEWLRTYNKKVVGICSGAQIIAKIHYASLHQHTEIGLITVKGKPPFKKEFSAYALHKNSISVSSDFEVMAENDLVQAFRIKQQIGLLFHPEVRNESLLKELMQ